MHLPPLGVTQRLLDADEHGGNGEAVFGADSAEVLQTYASADESGSADATPTADSTRSTAAEPRWLPFLRQMWPWLVNWHSWFLRTQSGELPDSFRWRGRDQNDQRLNAMTLSSGLDDYPRATTPSDRWASPQISTDLHRSPQISTDLHRSPMHPRPHVTFYHLPPPLSHLVPPSSTLSHLPPHTPHPP